ncbi:Fe(3+)-hydroxamate ABC transporter permease FhuB [Phyllobacterium leguminum]|uniref:Iron complex transport system permease protein n=1 Tax=Phyllobacterium leguminum TaxID=314237 RepID=A0A318SYG9_9HYPH|nr:Fe(3+)-hydroxamate ABC transporter permease FhuB [Phyllobacterium leguminum]PYE86497.1 iron complex transport system permease protein [Phyllobacterium leguminum]
MSMASPSIPLAGKQRKLTVLVALPALLAAALTISGLLQLLPLGLWWNAVASTDLNNPQQLLFRYAALPRLFIAPLVGAALGLTGVLLQQILRNPLAEPTTIGTNAGASLAITVATLYAPSMLDGGRVWVALLGGAVTTAIVFMTARGRAFSPVAVIMSGLIVSLTCSSAGALLMALNHEYSEELFIWQSGSLIQNGDADVISLIPWLAVSLVAASAMLRPLILLELGSESVQSLGSRPALIRMAGLGVAIVLSSVVVAYVGVISFVALAAPALVHLLGARSLRKRLIWAPLTGASLLWLTDRLVQIAPFPSEVPTGTATALLGAPLLLFLLARLRTIPSPAQSADASVRRGTWKHICIGIAVLVGTLLIALAFGRGIGGWHWIFSAELLELRAPRVFTALGCGIMLALAGTLMQRMTGNPMAAPEVLGISGGATIGVLALMLFTGGIDHIAMLAAALAGSFAALVTLLAVGRRNHFSSDQLLLAGVSLTTIASTFSALFIASGDQRVEYLLAWMAGSTYRATWPDAITAVTTALLLLGVLPLTARWLDILPLGETSTRALGVTLKRTRLILMLLIAIPTGVATLLIGPLSFVGLMAPHLARTLGFQRALPQLLASALTGGFILLAADWLGRTVIFPWQVPAGLLAAFIGGPYFMIRRWAKSE